MQVLYVAVGGVLGVLARYYMSPWVGRHLVSHFPYGTFCVNMLGAFLVGVVYVVADDRQLMSQELRNALIGGFLGGYTTFSAYCLEGVRLLEANNYGYALLYIVGSPVLGMLAAVAGMILGRLGEGV